MAGKEIYYKPIDLSNFFKKGEFFILNMPYGFKVKFIFDK